MISQPEMKQNLFAHFKELHGCETVNKYASLLQNKVGSPHAFANLTMVNT